jgi:hypothetical protein
VAIGDLNAAPPVSPEQTYSTTSTVAANYGD